MWCLLHIKNGWLCSNIQIAAQKWKQVFKTNNLYPTVPTAINHSGSSPVNGVPGFNHDKSEEKISNSSQVQP